MIANPGERYGADCRLVTVIPVRHSPAMWTGVAVGAALVSSVLSGVGGVAQENPEAPAIVEAARPSRDELRDKQLDAALEARDIERILQKLKRASDLSKQRIADAAQVTETASGALDRGDSDSARANAQQAAAMFQEIVKQLEALLEEETPQRIAAAQNLAQRLSLAERQFLRQFPGSRNPLAGGGLGKIDPQSELKLRIRPNSSRQGSSGGIEDKKEDGEKKSGKGNSPRSLQPNDQENDHKSASSGKPKEDMPTAPRASSHAGGGQDGDELSEDAVREALAQRAEELAEQGRTLKDVLQSILQSTEPADAEAVRLTEAVLKETKLEEALANMQQLAHAVRSGDLADAQLTGSDIADRLEIAAQRLGNAYRLVVAPQAEELRKIEQALAVLREKLDQLETPADVAAWHREARELLDQLSDLGIDDELRQQLLDEIDKQLSAGIAQGVVAWQVVDGRYLVPRNYQRSLIGLQEELQAKLQNLLLADLDASSDEATPPKYRELVERYYEVLSRDSGRRESFSANPADPRK